MPREAIKIAASFVYASEIDTFSGASVTNASNAAKDPALRIGIVVSNLVEWF